MVLRVWRLVLGGLPAVVVVGVVGVMGLVPHAVCDESGFGGVLV
jgi:hypothetical protein